ncbi:MAG: hypothetical protein WBM28_18005 [Burkholderiales bacterium]
MSWDAVIDTNVTGFRVYFSTTPFGSGGSPLHVDVNGSTATSTDIQPGTFGVPAGATLYVAVASTGAGGAESPISSPAASVVVQ